MAFVKRPVFLYAIGVLLVLATVLCSSAAALEVPKRPTGYVTDRAGLLPAVIRSRLESILGQFERTTTNQIVVVTLPSLEGDSLEAFSIRLAEAWKVGQRGKDNGVILLIVKDDRKMRIEVGYGLEGALTDAESSLIINQVMRPKFQQEDYVGGITHGVTAILKAVEGEFTSGTTRYGQARRGRVLTPQELEARRRAARMFGRLIVLAVLALFLLDCFRFRQYFTGHRGYQDRYSFWEWFFRFAVLLAVASLLFRVLLYAMIFSRGGYGGSRGGGGFSAGGGSFGGGGASGGW